MNKNMITQEYYDRLIEKMMQFSEHIDEEDTILLQDFWALYGYITAMELFISNKITKKQLNSLN